MQRMQNMWMQTEREQGRRQDASRVAKALLRADRQRSSRFGWGMRTAALITVLTTGGLPLTMTAVRAQEVGKAVEAHKPHVNWNRDLKPGTTDRLTPAQWKAVDTQRAKEAADKEAKKPDVRALTLKEMQGAHGSGPYRNPYFAGTLPWHRSLRDANLCNGNLFKSFTDIQVAPGRGAGLAMQRTYNSQDSRPGPFGVGWQQCYDIRMEEESPTNNQTNDSLNYSDRTDFFGAKHKYHRDADGLYSPPPYLFDECSSTYQQFLVNGPVAPLDDTQIGMDGTVKHFVKVADNWRACDYIQDRYGSKTTLAYGATADGAPVPTLLASVTDPVGRQLVYHWTNFGTTAQPIYRITGIDGPQYSVAYAYNQDANLASVTLDAGNATHLNRTSTYGYTTYADQGGSESGLLASVTDPLGHTVTYGYALRSLTGSVWVSSIAEPASNAGAVSTLTWNINTSPHTFYGSYVTNNAGLDWYQPMMDSQLRYRSDLVPQTYIHQVSYDSANNVTQSELAPNHNENGSFYPRFGPTTNYVGGLRRADLFTYGPHGNQLTHTVDGFTGTDTTKYYDGSQLFQKKSVTDMNGHVSVFGVGSKYAGLPVAQDPDPVNHDTNPGDRGSVLWVKDAKYGDGTTNNTGTRFQYSYNASGQKVREVNQNSVVTQYTYGDAWGNLTSVVQDPTPSPADEQTHLNRVTSMTYDIAGHVLTSTDPMGHVSTFSYNVLGQPISASFPATQNAQGVQVTPAENVSYVYDANGRTNSVTDNRGTTTLAYENGCDRVSSVSDPVTGTTSYTYGLAGQRLSMTLPGGGTWTYGYANQGNFLVQTCTKDDPNSLMPMLATLTDDAGRRIDVYMDVADGLHETVSAQTYQNTTLVSYVDTFYIHDADTYTQNTRKWLQTIRNTFHDKDASGQWRSRLLTENDYTYDTAGQRLTNTISSLDPATGNPTSRTEQYAYDELNRLTSVDYGDGQTQSYAFDSMGNRASKTDAGGGIGGTEAYTYNNANMLLSRAGNGYISDQNGNTLSGGGRTNTWDSQNRLVSCVNTNTPVFTNPNAAAVTNTSTFTYSSDGLRHRSVTNGVSTDFVLDSSMFVREMSGGSVKATYFMGASGPAYRRDDTTGQVSWYLYDGLGSVLGEVNSQGNITAKRKYDVYGLSRSVTGMPSSKHGFVGSLGHDSEDETGLIYMRARYYDPVIGRFASEDPAYHGSNWYVYARSSPTNLSDLSGREEDYIATIMRAAALAWSAYSQGTETAIGAKILLQQCIQQLETLKSTGNIIAQAMITQGGVTTEGGAELGAEGATLDLEIGRGEVGAGVMQKANEVAEDVAIRGIQAWIEML